MSEAGAYRLVRRIGWGIGGPVWVADGPLGQVAIRQLPSEGVLAGDRERFLHAGQQQMTLTDPAIVPTLQVIDTPDETAVVMQYLPVETLKSELLRRRFTPEESNALMRRVALALDFAHSRGVVHGDLKPSNIFLLPNQEVMVGDFAISPNARRDPLQPMTSNLVHPYLSPEHFNFPMLLEARSDQYSLAVIAYEMYTGRLPFDPAGAALTAPGAEAMAPSQVNPQIPPVVDSRLLKALSRNPAQRFNSCIEFISDLSAYLNAAPDTRAEKRVIRPIFLWAAGLLAIIAAFLLLRPGKKADPPAVVAQAAPAEATPITAPVSKGKKKQPPAVPPRTSNSGNPIAVRNVVKPDPLPLAPKGFSPSNPAPRPPALTRGAAEPAPANAARTFTLDVLSRTQRIPKGGSFAIGDAHLGELGHGDLKALVRIQGPALPPNKLTIEWSVNGVVTDRQKRITPSELVDYENEPTLGAYKVTVRLEGQSVAEFSFQITP